MSYASYMSNNTDTSIQYMEFETIYTTYEENIQRIKIADEELNILKNKITTLENFKQKYIKFNDKLLDALPLILRLKLKFDIKPDDYVIIESTSSQTIFKNIHTNKYYLSYTYGSYSNLTFKLYDLYNSFYEKYNIDPKLLKYNQELSKIINQLNNDPQWVYDGFDGYCYGVYNIGSDYYCSKCMCRWNYEPIKWIIPEKTNNIQFNE